MEKYQNNLTDRQGNALAGVSVTVTALDGTPAQLYSDNGVTTLSQPVNTDQSGYFSFYAANGHYSISVSGRGIKPYAFSDVALFDQNDLDASSVGYGNRTVDARLSDMISVRDLITTTIDGTTSNQAGIVSAVAAANAAGAVLYWPAGTYVSDASIPNLHAVTHIGPGIIKRGARTFALNPMGKSTQANGLYIATTGSAGNDGLSENEPMATFQNAFDALANYSLVAGNWSVVAAAGTYIGSVVQSFSQPSKNRVTVRGPAVGGHPNVPTAIIDGTGGTTYSHGLRATEKTYVLFQDLKFINFTAGGGGTRIGCLADVDSDVYTLNVHANGCDWAGVYASDATLRLNGGILEYCQYGVSAYHSRATVGYGGSASANRPQIRNNTQNGVYWTGISMGHVDYCDIYDNPTGIVLDNNARAHIMQCDFKRNTYAIRSETGSRFLDDTNSYNRGTANANTTDFDRRAYTGESAESRLAYTDMRMAVDRTTYTFTGTAAKTVVSTPYTLPAYRLVEVFQHLRVRVFGICTSMTNGASLSLDFGGVAGQTIAFNGAPAAGAPFSAEFLVTPVSKTAQRVFSALSHNLVAGRQNNSATAIDMTADRAVQISATLAASGDTLTIHRVEVYLLG